MFRPFDRHAGRPNRWENDDSALFTSVWFEMASQSTTMLDILPPHWMSGEIFALREFLTGRVTSVFLPIVQRSFGKVQGEGDASA